MVTIHTVPNNIANSVERWVTGTKIPWYYFDHTLGNDYKGRCEVQQDQFTIVDMPRLTHYFFPNSTSAEQDRKFVMPLTEWVKKNILPGYEVQRAMGNLTTQLPNSSNLLNIPHRDCDDDTWFTFLYYVNNSDGNTIFFKDQKIDCEVEPIKGTGVLFPSTTPHAGQVPSINKNRYVINILLAKRD